MWRFYAVSIGGNQVHDTLHSVPAKQQRLLATNDQAEMMDIERCQTNTHNVNACS